MKPSQFIVNSDKNIELSDTQFILRSAMDYLNYLYRIHQNIEIAGSRLFDFLTANKNKTPYYLLFDNKNATIPLNVLDQLNFQQINQIDELYEDFQLETLTKEIEYYFSSEKFKVTFDYNNKKYIINTLFDHIGRQIRKKKTFYESDLLYNLAKITSGGNLCIDAGANIGNHTLFFSTLYKKVIAIEPFIENVVPFIQTIKDNNLENQVFLLNAAISNDGRKMSTIAPQWNRGMCNMVSNEAGQPTITVDVIEEKIGTDKVDLIKIDCEIMSMEVFNCFLNIIKKNNPIVIIEATDEELITIKSLLPNYSIHGKYNATPTYILRPVK